MSEVVSNLELFAIKSCAPSTVKGEKPTQLEVEQTGFTSDGVLDRGLVIIEADGLFVSGRGWDEKESLKHPEDRRLLNVETDIADEGLVTAKAGSQGEITVPVKDSDDFHKSRLGRMFGKEFWGIDKGKEAADFFSEFLSRNVRVVQVDVSRPRYVDAEYQRDDASNRVAGADGFPFLWTREQSLADLHDRAGLPRGTVDLGRYRANIETSGEDLGPFGEDWAQMVTIGGLKAYVVKPCSRCPIPDVDLATSRADFLSLKLLRPTRTGWRRGANRNKEPKKFFGQNLNHVLENGERTVIQVGDPVSVIETASQSNVVLKNQYAV